MALPAVQQPMVFPNVETLLVAYLGGRSELAGVPVVLRLPAGYDGLSPTVVVTRVGGEFSVNDTLDRALVRLDTYGRDKAGSLDLTGTVRGLVWLLSGQQLSGVTVTEVSETRGPNWLRDPAFANANRYTTRYQMLVHIR